MKNNCFYEKLYPLKNNFPISLKKYTQPCLSAHWHEHLELLYIISGTASFLINTKSICATAGNLIIINSTEIHSFSALKPITYYCMQINPSFFQDIDFNNIYFENVIKCDSHITECVNSIYTELQNDTATSNMKVKSYAYSMLAYLTEKYTSFNISPNKLNQHHINLERLNEVFTHISSHYTEPISNETLAKMLFLSENYFCRLFKSITGKTVVNYINEYRVEKSIMFLENSQYSISQIASAVGFDDPNYFSRIFKKITNQTPSQYRKDIIDKDHS